MSKMGKWSENDLREGIINAMHPEPAPCVIVDLMYDGHVDQTARWGGCADGRPIANFVGGVFGIVAQSVNA